MYNLGLDGLLVDDWDYSLMYVVVDVPRLSLLVQQLEYGGFRAWWSRS